MEYKRSKKLKKYRDIHINIEKSYDCTPSINDLFSYLMDLIQSQSQNIEQYYELLNDIYSYLGNGKATLNDFSNFEFYCELLLQIFEDQQLFRVYLNAFGCLVEMAKIANSYYIDFPIEHLFDVFRDLFSNHSFEKRDDLLRILCHLPIKYFKEKPFQTAAEVFGFKDISINTKLIYFNVFIDSLYKESISDIIEFLFNECIPEILSPASENDCDIFYKPYLVIMLFKKCIDTNINETYTFIREKLTTFMSYGSFLINHKESFGSGATFLSIIYILISQGFELGSSIDILDFLKTNIYTFIDDYELLPMAFFVFASALKNLKDQNKIEEFTGIDSFLQLADSFLHENFALKLVGYPLFFDLILNDILTYPQYCTLFFHIMSEINEIDDVSIFEKAIACIEHIFNSLNDNKDHQSQFIAEFTENFNINDFIEHSRQFEIPDKYINKYVQFYFDNFNIAS